MNERNVIRYFLKIAGDMGGHQDRMVLVLDELQEDIQNIIPYYRIQAACGFIQDKQLRIVGEGGSNT